MTAMNLRPRFSIRTLLVLVTLAGLYFGCWEVTKRWGVEHRSWKSDERLDPFTSPFLSSPVPFVIRRDRYGVAIDWDSMDRGQLEWLSKNVSFVGPPISEYHFWFFGYTAKLPFQPGLQVQQPSLNTPNPPPSGLEL